MGLSQYSYKTGQLLSVTVASSVQKPQTQADFQSRVSQPGYIQFFMSAQVELRVFKGQRCPLCPRSTMRVMLLSYDLQLF